MLTLPVPQPPVCGVPGCPEPRLIITSLCPCEEGTCKCWHRQPECCGRHSSNCAGYKNWLRNDGIIDRAAIDIIVHDERQVKVTWVEALIATAVLMALGYPETEAARRLGFDTDKYHKGALRGPQAKNDILRAVAAINGLPPPVLPEPKVRKQRYIPPASLTEEQKEERKAKRRARAMRYWERMTPDERAAANKLKAEQERARRARARQS